VVDFWLSGVIFSEACSPRPLRLVDISVLSTKSQRRVAAHPMSDMLIVKVGRVESVGVWCVGCLRIWIAVL
jgi:hypothetical protein